MGMMLHRHSGVENSTPEVVIKETREVQPEDRKAEPVEQTEFDIPAKRGRKRKD